MTGFSQMLVVLAVFFCFFSVKGVADQRSFAPSDNSTTLHALSKRVPCTNLELVGDEALSATAAVLSCSDGGVVCEIVAADNTCHVTSTTGSL